jgi:hypothetical protein
MKARKRRISLPLGRVVLFTFQLNSLRDECCEAAAEISRNKKIDECELEECARLDDALADAQRVLKFAVAEIACSRIKRRSRVR